MSVAAATTATSTAPRRPRSSYQPGPSRDAVQSGAVLTRGHSGPAVKELQQMLNAAGIRPPLAEDGLLGPKTEAALKRFQAQRGDATGVADASTFAALKNAAPARDSWEAGGPPPGGPARQAPRADAPRPEGSKSAAHYQQADRARQAKGRELAGGDGQGNIQLDVPFYSQFNTDKVKEAYPGESGRNCFKACKTMAKAAGGPTPTHNKIAVASVKDEDAEGHVRTTREKTDPARAYIDDQLAQGHPVAVGVSREKNYYKDPLTEHYVLITGRGVDEQGRTYYTYNDPGSKYESKGRDRFYVDEKTGNLVDDGIYNGRKAHYDMTYVMKNAGS